MEIKAIYWDLGGVIVTDNLKPAFEQLKIPYEGQARFAWSQYRLGKIKQKEFYELALKNSGCESKLDELKELTDRIELKPDGALPVIESIALGYKQGVISNHSREWGKYIIERWNLRRFLNPIIISAEVGLDKSSNTIFYFALACLNVNPENTIFVDNNLKNVERAKKLGINGIHFENGRKLREDLESYNLIF